MAWKPKRRAAAVAQLAAVAGLPFVRIGGDSALRFDLPTTSLRAFGRVLRIDEFHLVLLAFLLLLVLLVGLTAILGRVWCGWLCGQTVLPELAAWGASAFPRARRRAAAEGLLLALSALVSFTLICYVLPPAEAARALLRSPVVAGIFFVQWAVVFGMTAILGPRFCATICPYAMLQNVLFDADTLAIGFVRDGRDGCLDCAACRRACPVGIDVREGLRRECIACAACVDACAAATAERRVAPFVGYRGRIFRAKAAGFAGAALAAAAALALAVELRPDAEASIRREGPVPAARVERFAWRVTNNRGRPLPIGVRVEGAGALIGDREFVVAPWSRREGHAMVRTAADGAGGAALVLSGPGIEVRSAVPPP